MKTIEKFENGQIKKAEVSYSEFEKLTFKHANAKILPIDATKENVKYISVTFNKKGQVCTSSAFIKIDDKTPDVAKMFNQVEDAIENKNVDREKAYSTAFDKLGIL